MIAVSLFHWICPLAYRRIKDDLRASYAIHDHYSTCRLIYIICQAVKLASDLMIVLYNKISLNIIKQSVAL